MACVELPPAHSESEMEEGEIVDELDDLSDISSEEEFLLRERLQVLESYNNVLERTKAKQISLGADGVLKVECTVIKEPKHAKVNAKVHKHKKSEHKKHIDKENGKIKNHKKKIVNRRKKSESSEESDDEYRNKRRKLADAVTLNKPKNDTSTLKDRITKMLLGNKTVDCVDAAIKDDKTHENRKSENDADSCVEIIENDATTVVSVASSKSSECIITGAANSDKNITSKEAPLESGVEEKNKYIVNSDESSDEDIELLRQNALQTKSSKTKKELVEQSNDHKIALSSEDEDSDTTELRMICLKSALLKKAIEMKQKQKLRKRLSQSTVQNDFEFDFNNYENHTDIESVDMEIGSDGDDKSRGNIIDNVCHGNSVTKNKENKIREEDIEEDEDLLRAKLLTSLTKNLPNLVDPKLLNTIEVPSTKLKKVEDAKPPDAKEEKKFIIQLGGSDSEGEHEATKNLTKMHMKLSEQEEFQRKLDIFLKSSRQQVEKNIVPDEVPAPPQKPVQKFVPKVMNSLPKCEQIEYKNLVKRMAELEKMKNARQSLINMGNQLTHVKETLKPSNIVKETNFNSIELDERISASRRKIADESAKMLKLKDEATKLSQKYKMLQMEMRNTRNAIRMNKTYQRTVQNSLCIIRLQHQSLLKSLTNVKHSNQITNNLNRPIGKPPMNKLQKENDPSLKAIKNPNLLKAVKVSVVNDRNADVVAPHPRLSVQVDITNNKKMVKSNTVPERIVDFTNNSTKVKNNENNCNMNTKHNEFVNNKVTNVLVVIEKTINDYESPLEALKNKSWHEDPNAFLCPFDVGGSCRDTDCKNLHIKNTQ